MHLLSGIHEASYLITERDPDIICGIERPHDLRMNSFRAQVPSTFRQESVDDGVLQVRGTGDLKK